MPRVGRHQSHPQLEASALVLGNVDLLHLIVHFLPNTYLMPSGIWHLPSACLACRDALKGWLLVHKEQVMKVRQLFANIGDPLTPSELAELVLKGGILNVFCCSMSDTDLTTLASVIRCGSMGTLIRYAFLDDNLIGDAGMLPFAGAIGYGALPQLEALRLRQNLIGDTGMIDFSCVIANGSLSRLESLDLTHNKIGNEGLAAFASASRSGSMGQFTQLGLKGNRIGDEGMKAFASAIDMGAMPNLRYLGLDKNPIGDEIKKAHSLRHSTYTQWYCEWDHPVEDDTDQIYI